MVGPGVMPDSVVDSFIGVSSALGAKLPDGPFFIVFGVEELDKLVERIPVCALRVGI